MRVGLLGLGFIGKIHNECAYTDKFGMPLATVDACFDLDMEKLSSFPNSRKYTDVDEFLSNEVGKLDFLDICLPTFMHKDVTVKALRMGYNVLCEKPMALNHFDTLEMCRASKKYGKCLMIAHVLRFSHEYRTIKRYITEKTLGNLRDIEYSVYTEGLPVGKNGWFRNHKLSGGSMLDYHVHDADILNYLLGNPKTVSCVGGAMDSDGFYSNFTTSLIYENGVFVSIHGHLSAPKIKHNFGRNLRLNFDGGYIIKNDKEFTVVDAKGDVTELEQIDIGYAYRNQVQYFINQLASGGEFSECMPEASSDSIKFVETEIASIKTGGNPIVFVS